MAVYNKHHKNAPPDAIYIGRGSRWGNPFKIGPDGTRDEVCDKHAAHLDTLIHARYLSLEELADLHGKDLVCFCAPARCHGDTLERKALWAFQQTNQSS
jgi:Domain of unknown function (DUF4326)